MGRLQSAISRSSYVLIATIASLFVWQAATSVFRPAAFLLPSPLQVLDALAGNWYFLIHHSAITFLEMLGGFICGCLAGIALAVIMAQSPMMRKILLPPVVTSQTLPVFAIAPLLVIWFGFGAGSKIIMASLIIFFPVASSFYDGLIRLDRQWLDLARGWGAESGQILFKIRAPAALPALASGCRIAATLAPIGAVVGEWAGASGGLGYVMLQANARLETDVVFASLIILALIAYLFRWVVSTIFDRIVFWQNPAS